MQVIKRRILIDVLVIIILFAIFGYFLNKYGLQSEYTPRILFIAYISVGFFVIIAIVDYMNYPLPNPGYRQFNKIYYLWVVGRLLFVSSVFGIIFRLIKFLNPWTYLNPRELTDNIIGLASATSSASIGIMNIRGAKLIEAYFENRNTYGRGDRT